MTQIAIHIYPLDDNEEAEEIIQLLNQVGIGERWVVERPTEETNSILVRVNVAEASNQESKVREQKWERAIFLLGELDKETIHKIKGMDVDVAVRIHTPESYLPIPAEFVSECGRLSLEICIFNQAAAFDTK
jgi:hypothetical protein